MTSRMPVLHVYSQDQWHDEAFVVGERAALVELRSAIDEALASDSGTGQATFAPADGEGFVLHVVAHSKERMDRMQLPYANGLASNSRKGRYPSSLVKHRKDDEIFDDDEWFALQRKYGFEFE